MGILDPKPVSTAAVDGIVRDKINQAGSATQGALNATYAPVSGPAAYGTAAAQSAQLDAGLTPTTRMLALERGPSGAWDNELVESLYPFWDHTSGRWAGVYVGYGLHDGSLRARVGLAFSDDLINWKKSGVVLEGTLSPGDLDVNGTSGPVVVFEDGLWHLVYIGLTGTGYEAGTKTIMLATNPNPPSQWTILNWTRRGAKVSKAGTGWRAEQVWHVSPVKRANTWYLFFNATGADFIERIGYATASTLLGAWAVNDVNSPILSQSATGWDSSMIGDPSVFRSGDGWMMHYFGVDTATGAASDGVATTTDTAFPLGWVKHPSNPLLRPGAAGSFDAKYAHKPVIEHQAGNAFHFYTAVDTNTPANRQIAVAVPEQVLDAPALQHYFRGVASTTSVGTADTGQVPVAAVGVFGIDGANRAYPTTLTGSAAKILYELGRPLTKLSVILDGTLPVTGQAVSVNLRYIDSVKFFELDVTAGGGVELVRHNAGAVAVATNASAGFVAGDMLTIEDTGSAIHVLRNGRRVLTHPSTIHAAGTQVGLRVYVNTGIRFGRLCAWV